MKIKFCKMLLTMTMVELGKRGFQFHLYDPNFLEDGLDDEEEKDEEDEDEDAGDVKDEKLWLLPEVVSVSGALPMLLFVLKLANPGKGANAQG